METMPLQGLTNLPPKPKEHDFHDGGEEGNDESFVFVAQPEPGNLFVPFQHDLNWSLRTEENNALESEMVQASSYSELAQYRDRTEQRPLESGSMETHAGPTAANKSPSGQEITSSTFVNIVELWRTPMNEAWVTIQAGEHREYWPLKGKTFRSWLAHQHYEKEGAIPSAAALRDELTVMEGQARFKGATYPMHCRVAEYNGAIYLDLANDRWEVVEITSDGWRIIADSPVRFRRTNTMLPLPYPVSGGSIEDLRAFINISSSEDWTLLISWLVATLRPRGPYPILELNGEQGSAKSTLARILRSLVDPAWAPLRTSPRSERDLLISALSSQVLAYDNLSAVPTWLSDAFCRLATGGGFSTRLLYTDAEEMFIDVQRPALLTGIEDLAMKGDLLDRTIQIVLQSLSEADRKPEALMWSKFEAVRSRILGALLTIVAGALRALPMVSLTHPPRMADFAAWATAAESPLGWQPGTFMAAYTCKRRAMNDVVVEGSAVACAVTELVKKWSSWQGTARELLGKLNEIAPGQETKANNWPKSPLNLANALRRLAPNLRAAGISAEFSRSAGTNSRRLITLEEFTSVAGDAIDA